MDDSYKVKHDPRYDMLDSSVFTGKYSWLSDSWDIQSDDSPHEYKIVSWIPIGWVDLVTSFADKVEMVVNDSGLTIMPWVLSIKEHQGKLQLKIYFQDEYTKEVRDTISKLCYETQSNSRKICRYCGKEGEVRIKKRFFKDILVAATCDYHKNFIEGS